MSERRVISTTKVVRTTNDGTECNDLLDDALWSAIIDIGVEAVKSPLNPIGTWTLTLKFEPAGKLENA